MALDIEIHENIDLSRYSTMRLESIGNLCVVNSEESLIDLVKDLKAKNKKWRMLGWGANQLFPKDARGFIYIKLDFKWNQEDFNSDLKSSYFPASVSLNNLVSLAKKNSFKGWEALTGIPASLGGALFMNAGTRLGEICEITESVRVLDENLEIYTHKVSSDSFSYRKNNFLKKNEIILGANLFHHEKDDKTSDKITEYLNYRKSTQPLKSKNCGCVFKNLEDYPVGKLIDDLGLKGYSNEYFQISNIHGNFIEHLGGGNLDLLAEFIQEIKSIVFDKKGLNIECEVQY